MSRHLELTPVLVSPSPSIGGVNIRHMSRVAALASPSDMFLALASAWGSLGSWSVSHIIKVSFCDFYLESLLSQKGSQEKGWKLCMLRSSLFGRTGELEIGELDALGRLWMPVEAVYLIESDWSENQMIQQPSVATSKTKSCDLFHPSSIARCFGSSFSTAGGIPSNSVWIMVDLRSSLGHVEDTKRVHVH